MRIRSSHNPPGLGAQSSLVRGQHEGARVAHGPLASVGCLWDWAERGSPEKGRAGQWTGRSAVAQVQGGTVGGQPFQRADKKMSSGKRRLWPPTYKLGCGATFLLTSPAGSNLNRSADLIYGKLTWRLHVQKIAKYVRRVSMMVKTSGLYFLIFLLCMSSRSLHCTDALVQSD